MMNEAARTTNDSPFLSLRIGDLLSYVCFITVFSQMPLLVEKTLTRYLSMPSWILLLGICLLKKLRIPKDYPTAPITAVTIFSLYLLVRSYFHPQYLGSELIYPVYLSFFMYCIGSISGVFVNAKDYQKVITAYILASSLVCFSVFITFVIGNSISSYVYIYESKNSVSQILLTGIILIVTHRLSVASGWKKLLYVSLLVFMGYVVLALKSRATIFVIPLLVIIIAFDSNTSKSVRKSVIITVALIILALAGSSYYRIILENVLYAGRIGHSLDAVSSGRLSQWASFMKDMSGYWLTGRGHYSRESLLLTAFLEYGLPVGSVIVYLATFPLLWIKKRMNKTHPYHIPSFLIAVSYLFNGIFEQLSPFGPGAKCFFLWLVLGILTTIRDDTIRVTRS